MAYAKGRCIVTKQEGPCLVLPQGTFSPARITFLSKEGSDKLVGIMKQAKDDGRKSGICCINRKAYDSCIIIPRGVINAKVQYLMSEEAIEGMSSELGKMPADITEKEETPEPTPAPKPQKEEPVLEPTSAETEPPKEEVKEEEPPPKKTKSGGIPKKDKSYADPSSGKTIEVDE